MKDCHQIFLLVKELKAGCSGRMCGNKKLLVQIRSIATDLEIKMFAFPIVLKLEGRGIRTEKIVSEQIYCIPGKTIY